MQKKNTTKKITASVHVLIGLPGAGKTTFADSWKRNGIIVDCDNAYDRMRDKINIEGALCSAISEDESSWNKKYNFMFDGPFFKCSELTLYKYLNEIHRVLTGYYDIDSKKLSLNVVFHYWKPDVDTCLYNDSVRNRTQSAKDTILNTHLVKPDIEVMTEIFINDTKAVSISNFDIVEHKTERADVFSMFVAQNAVPDQYNSRPKYLISCSWNPMTDAPAAFDSFEDCLFTICPDISYLMFRKIWRESHVSAVVSESFDYYSTSKDVSMHYSVNVDDLRAVLEKYSLIQNHSEP